MSCTTHPTPAAKLADRGLLRLGHKEQHRRKGAVIVLAAFMMIVLMAMLAFAVDVGYILKVDTDLDRAVDAAALAGAGVLVDGQSEAEAEALEFLVRNPAGFPVVVDEENLAALTAEFLEAYGEELEMEVGQWDSTMNGGAGGIDTSAERPSAIRVSVSQSNHPFFFGRVFGKDYFAVKSEAIGSYQPRDIMLVLDFSGSMNDDSEFKSYDTLTQEAVDANLAEMYAELGSPAYGTLPFECEWPRCKGDTPGTPGVSQNYVTYKDDEAYVETSENMYRVKLYFSGGSQNFYPSGTTYTAKGSGSYSGKRIKKVRVYAGSGSYETFNFNSDNFDDTVEEGLGLDHVAWPGSSGSWKEYLRWVDDSSGQNYDAGYRYKPGVKSLLVYLLQSKPSYSQTPFLHTLSAQPVTAVKDAVDLFVDYIQEVDTDDRMGLSVYNSYSGDGVLETGMTSDMDSIKTISRARQAGHYHSYTNIGAGMTVAREEISSNSRSGAARLMVVMTDGKANWAHNGYSTSEGYQYVLDEAALAKAAKIPIMTISLGAGADTSLMQQVADITDGVHYIVEGGQSISGLEADLRDVFKSIADDRPLQIVK